jgi:pyridoxine/pyridoxamine 5'-phosphate oxidase
VLLESGQIVTEGAVETVFAEYTERLTSHRPTDSKVTISASSES